LIGAEWISSVNVPSWLSYVRLYRVRSEGTSLAPLLTRSASVLAAAAAVDEAAAGLAEPVCV
jgi:hypothetical protein